MSIALHLSLQALAEYGGITSSVSSGFGATLIRRAEDIVRLAGDHIVIVAAVVLGILLLWRVLTRPALR